MKIFITGNSRSGTTMMSRILGNHESVYSFQELHFFDEIVPNGKATDTIDSAKAAKIYASLCAIQRNGYFGSRNPTPFLTEAREALNELNSLSSLNVFEKFLVSEAKKNKKAIPCEQTPQNIFSLNDILTHVKDAKVIIMVRDPRQVMLSQKNKWKRRKLSGGEIPRLESIRSRINYHPVTISKIWKSAMQTASKFLNNPSVMIVKYEELIQNPEKIIKQVCAHCSLTFNEAMLDIPVVGSSNFNDSRQQRGIDTSKINLWENGGLNNTEIDICQKINGDLMHQFGYELKSVNDDLLQLSMYRISMPFRMGLALLFNLKRLRYGLRILSRRGTPARRGGDS